MQTSIFHFMVEAVAIPQRAFVKIRGLVFRVMHLASDFFKNLLYRQSVASPIQEFSPPTKVIVPPSELQEIQHSSAVDDKSSLTDEELEEALESLDLEEELSDENREKITDTLNAINKQERDRVIASAKQLVKALCSDTRDQPDPKDSKIDQMLNDLFNQKNIRIDALCLILTSLEKMQPSDISEIEEFVKKQGLKIFVEDVAKLLEIAAPFKEQGLKEAIKWTEVFLPFTKIEQFVDVVSLFEQVVKIPQDQRNQSGEVLRAVCSPKITIPQIDTILGVMPPLSEDQTNQVTNFLILLSQRKQVDFDGKCRILNKLKESSNQVASKLSIISDWIEPTMPYWQILDILDEMSKIDPAKIDQVVESVDVLRKKGQSARILCRIIKLVANTAKEDGEKVVEILIPWMEESLRIEESIIEQLAPLNGEPKIEVLRVMQPLIEAYPFLLNDLGRIPTVLATITDSDKRKTIVNLAIEYFKKRKKYRSEIPGFIEALAKIEKLSEIQASVDFANQLNVVKEIGLGITGIFSWLRKEKSMSKIWSTAICMYQLKRPLSGEGLGDLLELVGENSGEDFIETLENAAAFLAVSDVKSSRDLWSILKILLEYPSEARHEIYLIYERNRRNPEEPIATRIKRALILHNNTLQNAGQA